MPALTISVLVKQYSIYYKQGVAPVVPWPSSYSLRQEIEKKEEKTL